MEAWLAEKRFHRVKMPVLWLCWNADSPFSLNSNSKSYLDTVQNNPNTRLSAVHEMQHSHWHGWVREESYVYADWVCKGEKRLPAFPIGSTEIGNPDHVPIKKIRLYYLTEPMGYEMQQAKRGMEPNMAEQWKIKDCAAALDSLPANAREYYFEITSEIGGKEYITTSEIRKVEKSV